MTNRVKLALAVLAAVLLALAVWQCLRSGEPSYQGRTLTAWLLDYVAADKPFPITEEEKATMHRAGDAIRDMGTNAVPHLIKLVSAKDSSFKHIITIIAQHQSIVRVNLRTEKEKRQMAVFGFYALGPMGKSAVPALVELLNSQDHDVRLSAADCLGNIGPDAKAAVPLLLPYLNSTNRIVAWDTTVNLGRIHMEPELVVPALVQHLVATNISMHYRGTTIDALARFGEQGKEAVPHLIPFLTDTDEGNRFSATNALKTIDADAAAKAGVR
ncbi:MAG TPA: HEAT repeat domain-containing protein [Clostridia bacterium]|nr:HEAT repeat domain-containing protein [Clostridia bacterium]